MNRGLARQHQPHMRLLHPTRCSHAQTFCRSCLRTQSQADWLCDRGRRDKSLPSKWHCCAGVHELDSELQASTRLAEFVKRFHRTRNLLLRQANETESETKDPLF